MTDKEKLGFEKSGAADLIGALHRNRVGEAVRHVAVGLGVVPREEPVHPDQIADPAEHARAISRAQLAAMFSGEAPANKLDEDVSVQKREHTDAPAVRKGAFADTWHPGMTYEEEKALLARRVAAREGR